jgi:hypothetical protein
MYKVMAHGRSLAHGIGTDITSFFLFLHKIEPSDFFISVLKKFFFAPAMKLSAYFPGKGGKNLGCRKTSN